MSAAAKVLIVGPSWIGDMVMAQSLFKVLRQQDPAVTIDVLAPAWSGSLLARMPEVRRSVNLPVGHGELGLGRLSVLGRELRDESYQRAIILPRSMKSAVVPFVARIPVRTGFRGEWRYGILTDVRKLDKQRLDQTVKRFVALGVGAEEPLPQLPYPALGVDESNRAELLERLELSVEPSPIVMIPGAAYGPAKCWPLEYFSDLTKRLAASGRQVWVLGSEKERDIGDLICAGTESAARNLCGLTRLQDTVDLLSLAANTVTNDSGLMHVAAATGCRVTAIYGSTTPSFTPPLTDRKTIHYLGLECSPCFERECPLGHLRCLKEISPEAVEASIKVTTS